jgi:tetratricopeptide (TPR) repeat protein
MFFPRFRLFLIGCILPSVITIVRGQEPQWPVTGAPFSASPADIQAAAAKISTDAFAEATVLFERDAYSLDTAGRMTYKHTMVYRIETQQAIEGWSETRVRWAPWYQNPPEIHARVIAADGKVSTLDPKTITDGPAREDSQDTYTDDRVRKVPLPAIAVGSIVEEETVSTDKAPFFAQGGVYSDSYSRSVPSVRIELLVDVPESTNFRYKLHALPNAQIKNEVQGGIRHFSLQQGYLPGLADSDIDLPSHEIAGPLIEFSTGESWASVADGYRRLAEANIDPDTVKSLVPHADADRSKTIAQTIARLHKEVRYTGIEFGEASLQPAAATDVLKHHYGDCKDKAALLVAMLRSNGVPAHLALLDTGPGPDVDPELPGMSLFDHAIVYIPKSQDSSALWIDATAEFTEVGTLPSMDQGRLALIIRDGTTELTPTPDGEPNDDQLIELRDVTLFEYGPAKITETSLTHGAIDASYRSLYGNNLTRETKADLESYAKDTYMAKTLDHIGHGESHDLSQPFALKLEMADARRGFTSIDDAVVGIPFAGIFSRLPEWFRTDPKTEGEKLSPQQQENQKRAIAARATEYDVHPFATEWRYIITTPEGFTLRVLPKDKTTNLGPTTLAQRYTIDAQGNINATLRFETVKQHYTIEDTLALRDAVLAAYKQDIIELWFDQTGAKLMAGGKIKDALAADRALIAKHPSEGLHHAQISYAYVKAGLGELAKNEAEQATRLDPKSPVGFRALGWACQFNEIGVQLARGFDWDCATKAFKKAIELEPDDSNTIISLAFLNEYDREGERYTANAHLADAIAGFRALKQKDKSAAQQYDDNVLFDLLYSGRYKELLEELEKLPASASRRGMSISATVALDGGQKGVTSGVARADQLAAGTQDRNAALSAAGNQLLRMRLYPEAAGIMAASVEGQQDSAATTQQISVFRQLSPWKDSFFPPTDPRSVVQKMFLSYLTGRFDEKTANEVLARSAYGSEEEWKRNFQLSEQQQGMMHAMASRSNLPAAVLLDVVAGNLKFTAQGDDDSGHIINVDSLGAKSRQYFVTRESGGYHVVTDGNTPPEAGFHVLYLLKAGRNNEAKSLLDWTRERMHKGGGDDPLAGPVFPRLWTSGDQADRGTMEIAAAALIAGNPAVKDILPQLRVAREKAATEEARLGIALLLAYGYQTVEDAAHLNDAAAELLKKFPDSYTAIELAGSAFAMLNDWSDYKEMLNSRLAKRPDDEELLRLMASYNEAHGDWDAARSVRQALIDKGKAKPNDYNMYGWTALFDNKVNEDAIKQARQAALLTNNASFAELHTLACLYAAQGKTSEAHDLLLKALSLANLSVPNSELWYGFGSIYEQYGITNAAVNAYSKVEKPIGRIGPTSTYLLAQTRLKALKNGGLSANH